MFYRRFVNRKKPKSRLKFLRGKKKNYGVKIAHKFFENRSGVQGGRSGTPAKFQGCKSN